MKTYLITYRAYVGWGLWSVNYTKIVKAESIVAAYELLSSKHITVEILFVFVE